MRRAALVLGVLVLLGSCADHAELPSGLSDTLQARVAKIRAAAESERPGIAIHDLGLLVDVVAGRLDAGTIDEARAMEILEAASVLEAQLRTLPRPSPEPTTPSPSEEGDPGEGNGKGKGKGNGHGDEGHGNDD